MLFLFLKSDVCILTSTSRHRWVPTSKQAYRGTDVTPQVQTQITIIIFQKEKAFLCFFLPFFFDTEKKDMEASV